ncbi:unnamed protein product [Caenorhabditis auriculariae]|uniref:TM2 domain-containing protein n=1 Tax=Caenorhabditis auriculariae TaxID=2777116 RepID=A0A8S1GTN6_9PELO|nr:unnamed protein product [Caenorhabditis auriculariae]
MLRLFLLLGVLPAVLISGIGRDCEKSRLHCRFPDDCRLGETVTVNCTTGKECGPQKSLVKKAECRFCWQTRPEDHDCKPVTNCSTSSGRLHKTLCRVHSNVICIGVRNFHKKIRCNWSSGHSWSRTMFLSVVVGGFGADRFYLGLWKSAIGKLFSFGGLGVWTIIDVVLIAVGYIKPADGSMYI